LAGADPGVRYVAYREQVMQPTDLPAQHGHAFWHVLQRRLSRALIDQVLTGGDVAATAYLAANPTTPPDVVETLLHHSAPAVRRRIAERTDLTGDQLARLATDPAVEVRTAVSTHPGLTEQQRAAITIDVTTAEGDGQFATSDELYRDIPYRHGAAPDLTDALRWAHSANPLLRRRAARNPALPIEAVTLLADDPDLGVRVLLAGHHPAASPALLLRGYLEYTGYGRTRLAQLPQFPTEGLARFADHPDPAVRGLVALDPLADPVLVDRLTADLDATVRQATASCARLPVPRIVALLADPELDEAAAANPALPLDRMWQILHSSNT
jgi:hypothetical protein